MRYIYTFSILFFASFCSAQWHDLNWRTPSDYLDNGVAAATYYDFSKPQPNPTMEYNPSFLYHEPSSFVDEKSKF